MPSGSSTFTRSSCGWSSPFQITLGRVHVLAGRLDRDELSCLGGRRQSEHDQEEGQQRHHHESSFRTCGCGSGCSSAIGRELADGVPAPRRHPVKALDDRAMELASRDAELRAALFRLVDVTPACRSLDDLARHLAEYLDEVDERPPPLERRDARGRLARRPQALGAAAAAGVRHMAHRFIVGESPEDALKTLRGLWDDGVATTVDLLGEATVTSAEADRYAARCAERARSTLAAAHGEVAEAAPAARTCR